MPVLLIGVAWFVLVMGVVSVLAYRYWAKPAAYLDRVGPNAADEAPSLILDDGLDQPGIARVIRLVGEAVPTSPAKVRALRRRLMAAGFRSESAVAVLYGIRVAAGVAAALVMAVILTTFHPFGSEGIVAASLLAGLGGYMLPGEVLQLLVHRRRRILRHSLPDALDLMVICVESGLGLDQAILELSSELRLSHPELSEELSLVTLELRAGKRRSEALKNLADRTGEEEFKKLVGILIQTDRFGTSIAQALRAHSEFMRVKRRQVAEEKANKVGVKLVFPIFFFILPSMFLVTVGPALLELFFEFFPMMRATQ